jgi:pyruvate-formate lyase-activating enzyme
MYTNIGNKIKERYPGRYLAAVDTAIESMPMVHYHPRGRFLQVCTVGCNFKCQGCVSEILTDHVSAMEGTFQKMTPGQVIDKALSASCIGVMFCFNEPTVSYFTFKTLAQMAQKKGLLVGCSTNGYMTQPALEGLMPYLDFVNLGLKGMSQEAYRNCGISNLAPIWRNLTQLFHRGVHIEISAIFRKHGEKEIQALAAFVATLSKEIPFQVMRFIPFKEARIDMEPSVKEAEAVCQQLRQTLAYVYLFNTPGTEDLNTYCPDCGATLMARGFFGPMCSNLYDYVPQGRCNCGFQLPIRGKIHDTPTRETGYFGGYKTINALNMIRSLLGILGETDKACVDAVMLKVIQEDFIKGLYERLNRIDSYLDTMDYFAALTGHQKQGKLFREYIESRVAQIQEKIKGVTRPAVYCSLGHPLIAMFEEKMESLLVETAGGRLTNRSIERESRPGITITPGQFCRMAPEIIIISDGTAWPVQDFISHCTNNGLAAPAVTEKKIFHLYPFRSSTNPDWILGLYCLANIIHPEIFGFDLQKEADDFYQTFYHLPFTGATPRIFPWQNNKKKPMIQNA